MQEKRKGSTTQKKNDEDKKILTINWSTPSTKLRS